MDEKTPRRPLDWLNHLPLLLIPVLICNLVAAASASPAPGRLEPGLAVALRADAFMLPTFSGVSLALTWGDMLLLLTFVFLIVEAVRTARRGAASIVNPLLTMAVFLLCAVEFLIFPRFASSTFFLLTMIVLLQALSGISLWLARRKAERAAES